MAVKSQESITVAIDARYVREKPSGIGAYVKALVDRLPSIGGSDHFLFWAHPLASPPLSAQPNTSEITVHAAPASPWPLLWPQRYGPFTGVDLFHSPHNILPRALPCASVVTVHDVMAIDQPKLHLQGIERLFKSKYYQQAVWRALRHATRLIAPSKAAADRICALTPGAAARMTVIWEGAEDCFRPPENRSAAQERATSLIGEESPYLLLVGANAPTKRHALAIAAFAAVPPPWRLVLLQRRKARGQLVRVAARLKISDRIVWLDAVEQRDVVALMQAADALVQPSVYEGFGLPVLEAMACGLPVVASDIAPFREITGGAAIFFPPDDVERLGQALKGVVQSAELRQALAQQGIERAREFSWDRCARETLEVYREAVASQK